MFCSQCGKELPENPNIHKCGVNQLTDRIKTINDSMQRGSENSSKNMSKNEVIQNKYNKISVIGFILSIVSIFGLGFFGIIGIILGIVALVQINKTKENGKGLAVAAIIIGSVFGVLASKV